MSAGLRGKLRRKYLQKPEPQAQGLRDSFQAPGEESPIAQTIMPDAENTVEESPMIAKAPEETIDLVSKEEEQKTTPSKAAADADSADKTEAPTYNSIEEIAVDFNERFKQLDKSEADWMRGKLEELTKSQSDLKDVYEKNKGTVQWAQLADTLGKAFTQLAAGMYGMRTGTDMSGVKFKPSDWSDKYRRLIDEYEMGLKAAQEKTKGEQAVRDAETEEDRDNLQRQYVAAVKDFSEGLREKRRLTKEAERRGNLDDLAKEREKVKESFRQARGLLADIDADRVDAEKALPKIRKLIKGEAAEFEEAAEQYDAGWLGRIFRGDDPEALPKLLERLEAGQLRALTPEAEQEEPAQDRPSPTPQGKVRVRAPDGQIGTIPEDRLQDALNAGMELVE